MRYSFDMHKGMVKAANGEFEKVTDNMKERYSRLRLAYRNISLKMECPIEDVFQEIKFYSTMKMYIMEGKTFTKQQYDNMVDAITKYKLTSAMGVPVASILNPSIEHVMIAATLCSGYAKYDTDEKILELEEQAKQLATTINLINMYHE